jgi:hypothetical protein
MKVDLGMRRQRLFGLLSLVVLVAASTAGTAQARSHSRHAPVAHHAKKKKKKKTSNRGPRGARGPAGSTGASGSQGAQGPQGPAGPLTTTLPAGQTLRGTFSVRGKATAANDEIQQGISFDFTLNSAPTVNYVNFGAPAPAACAAGTAANPQASAGNLCVYESVAPTNSTTRGEFDAISGNNNTATSFGFAVFADAVAAGDYRIRGSWAVTGS